MMPATHLLLQCTTLCVESLLTLAIYNHSKWRQHLFPATSAPEFHRDTSTRIDDQLENSDRDMQTLHTQLKQWVQLRRSLVQWLRACCHVHDDTARPFCQPESTESADAKTICLLPSVLLLVPSLLWHCWLGRGVKRALACKKVMVFIG